MCCVLKVFGEQFNVDAFLADCSLRPVSHIRRGQTSLLRKSRKHLQSGCVFSISRGFGKLEKHTKAATKHLLQHREEIVRLVQFPGVTAAYLDFGYDRRVGVVVQSDHLPKELIKLAGELGLSIEMSLYPPSGSHPPKCLRKE